MKIIYKITNIINQKIYIGQTKNFERRKREHYNQGYNRVNKVLYSAMEKYGNNNFIMEKIEEVEDENGRVHGYFTEIYGRRGSLMYNCKGEPLSIHVFMNVLINMEGIVHQAKCIQWEKTRYELLLNADREKVDEKEVVDSYRHYLGEEAQIDVTYVDEIPIQASGKRMVCENRCPDYQ